MSTVLYWCKNQLLINAPYCTCALWPAIKRILGNGLHFCSKNCANNFAVFHDTAWVTITPYILPQQFSWTLPDSDTESVRLICLWVSSFSASVNQEIMSCASLLRSCLIRIYAKSNLNGMILLLMDKAISMATWKWTAGPNTEPRNFTDGGREGRCTVGRARHKCWDWEDSAFA